MFGFIKKRAPILAIILCFFSSVNINLANAAEGNEEVFAAFEWFCLSHLEKPASIVNLFPPIGIQQLPKDKADAFLAPKEGKAWLLPGSYTKGILITLTSEGVCTVSGPYVKGAEAIKIFEDNTKNIKLNSEIVGSQILKMYAVISRDATSGEEVKAIVSVATSNLKSIDGVILSALPYKLALVNNIHVPNWPQ